MLWLAAEILEPYLIEAAVSLTDPGAIRDARRSATGWANSSIWLAAEVLCIAVALFAGFLSRRLSPSRSWVAPSVLLATLVLYFLFAQFPATKVPWRIALWSLGLPLALLLGAWLSSSRQNAA
jgi:MFS-type transporter involved in bile tolerance (Atg22 family)